MPIDEIAAALTPQTTLVSVASPQNPSGIRFDTHELTELLAVMADGAPDAFLLVDETCTVDDDLTSLHHDGLPRLPTV